MSRNEKFSPPYKSSKGTNHARKVAYYIALGLATLSFLFVVGRGVIWLWYGEEDFHHSKFCCAPANLIADPDSGMIALRWTPVPDAILYQISKGNRQGGPYWLAGSPYGDQAPPHLFPRFFERVFYLIGRMSISNFGYVPYSHFTDTSDTLGTLRYYRVRAFLGKGWTPWTSAVSAQVTQKVSPPIEITVNTAVKLGPLVHKWDLIGAEHIGYILNDDGISSAHGGGGINHALSLARKELGFQYVIAHGVFMSDMGIFDQGSSSQKSYHWGRIDAAYDKILADGMRPVVQLSFMPAELALHPREATISSYHGIASPPRDYQDWASLVSALTLHLESRYGASTVRQWAFDVWNEPDVCVPGVVCYWQGSAEEYFRLYDSSVEAIRSVDPLLRVGGPVVVNPTFVDQFLNHVANHRYSFSGHFSPLDFLDVRVYDNPVANWRPLLAKYNFSRTQVWYTEWGLHNLGKTHITDSVYAAAWITNNLLDSLEYVDRLGFWNVSDDFIERRVPRSIFHGGYGILSLYEIPKPSYWAYYMLNQLGNEKVAMTIMPSQGSELIRGCATINSADNIQIILGNATNIMWQKAEDKSLDRKVTLTINNLRPRAFYSLKSYRVDEQHGNVLDAWNRMGSPEWPTLAQLSKLRSASSLQFDPMPSMVASDRNGSVSIVISLPMPSVSLLSLSQVGQTEPVKKQSNLRQRHK